MKRGTPPTARNARTGELTPPGVTAEAWSNSAVDRAVERRMTALVYVRRFSRTERALHWIHASAFLVLLGSGLDITAMNRIRKRFSRWGGGKLARALAPARVRVYVVSDVIVELGILPRERVEIVGRLDDYITGTHRSHSRTGWTLRTSWRLWIGKRSGSPS